MVDKVRIVQPGDGHTVPFFDGAAMTFLARGADTHDLVSFWEFNLPGGGVGPPPHVHHGHDEIFYVIDGTLRLLTEGEPTDVTPGSLVIVPRHAQHTFANPGTAPMRMVGTFSPARFEGYFDELAAEIAKHEGARPDPSIVAALYAKYDSELV